MFGNHYQLRLSKDIDGMGHVSPETTERIFLTYEPNTEYITEFHRPTYYNYDLYYELFMLPVDYVRGYTNKKQKNCKDFLRMDCKTYSTLNQTREVHTKTVETFLVEIHNLSWFWL